AFQEADVAGIRCARTRPTTADASGRVGFEMIEGSEQFLACDTLVVAIGQLPDIAWLQETGMGDLCDCDLVAADATTGATCHLDVFACGDCVTGGGPLVEAMAAGKRAAFSIDAYLRGEPVAAPEPALPRVDPEEVIREAEPVVLTRRQRMPRRPAAERVKDFAEVALGYPEELGRAEAQRCLDCGRCSNCGDCMRVCPWVAIDRVADVTRVDPEKCDSCGLCPLICPQGAIELVPREEVPG
ncbi:MAG: 4Fe-4S dicluster domain-containing protein, partial [Armatimonadota bacterium]